MNMYSIPEKNKFCRLCLAEEDKFVPIFTENEDIHKYIHSFFAVEIKKDDPFSTKICKTCLHFVIEIIRKRLRYRENDLRLKDSWKRMAKEEQLERKPETVVQNSNTVSEKPDPVINTLTVVHSCNNIKQDRNNIVEESTNSVDKQQNTTKKTNNVYMHPTVLDIFKIDEKITIPPRFWACNFGGVVIADGQSKPWPRYKKTNPRKTSPKRKRRIFSSDQITNSGGGIDSKSTSAKKSKIKRLGDDPSFYRNVGNINANKGNVISSKQKNNRSVANSQNGTKYVCDIAQDVKQKRRKTLNIERFGTPVLYEQTDFDALDIIMSDDPQCESYYIYNVNHDRPDIENLQYNGLPVVPVRENKKKSVKKKKVSLKSNHKKPVKSPKNDLKKREVHHKIRNQSKPQTINGNFQGDKPNNYKLVNCSEDKWNSFFNNFYEKPEHDTDSDSSDEGNCFKPLLLMNEKRVYICHLCEKVFYTSQTHKKHVLTHDKKSPTFTSQRLKHKTSNIVTKKSQKA